MSNGYELTMKLNILIFLTISIILIGCAKDFDVVELTQSNFVNFSLNSIGDYVNLQALYKKKDFTVIEKGFKISTCTPNEFGNFNSDCTVLNIIAIDTICEGFRVDDDENAFCHLLSRDSLQTGTNYNAIAYLKVRYNDLDRIQVSDITRNIFLGDIWAINSNSGIDSDMYPSFIGEAVSFTIGNLGYIGTGLKFNGQFNTSTFWSYDTATEKYKRLANYPGINEGRRKNAVGFSVNGKGYIGSGLNNNEQYKDFYEYTPETDSWRRITDFPFLLRSAVSFVIDNEAYVGTGWSCDPDCRMVSEFYKLNPEGGELDSFGLPLGEWLQIASLPSNGRRSASAFSIDSKGYIVCGVTNSGRAHINDVFEYDPTLNSWTKKSNFTGAARQKGIAFVVNNRAFYGTGSNSGLAAEFPNFNDLWEYLPTTDSWNQLKSVGIYYLHGTTAFGINSKGYLYGGYEAQAFQTNTNDLRIYTPSK